MLKAVQTMEAWLVTSQRKAKTLVENLCEESVSAGAEESAVNNKRPEPLKENLCFAGTMHAGWLGLNFVCEFILVKNFLPCEPCVPPWGALLTLEGQYLSLGKCLKFVYACAVQTSKL